MNYQEKIKNSETHVFKVVFPNITNHHNTMFGGTVMEMMDQYQNLCLSKNVL